MKLYICGPMRGHKHYNFDAFFDAERSLQASGHEVVSPARQDLEEGFDPYALPEDTDWSEFPGGLSSLSDVAVRDILLLSGCEGIVLLRGWEKSKGAKAEQSFASWLGLAEFEESERGTFVCSRTADPEREGVLDEAKRITSGDRQAQYGPPNQDFARTAKMWSALKGVHFDPYEVASFQICLKLSRQTHQRKRDNWVDTAGYAHCGNLCDEAEGVQRG